MFIICCFNIVWEGGGGSWEGREYNSAYTYQHMATQKSTNCYPFDKTFSNKQNQKQFGKPEKSNIFSPRYDHNLNEWQHLVVTLSFFTNF